MTDRLLEQSLDIVDSASSEGREGKGDSSPPGMRGVREEDRVAYTANYCTHTVGISIEETIDNYNLWAQRGTYEMVSV